MSVDAMPGIQSAEISGGSGKPKFEQETGIPGNSEAIEIKGLKQTWKGSVKVIQGDEVSKLEQ